MNTALIEAHYLPSISYFSLLHGYDVVMLEKHEHYQKQSYRNRCFINSANGREMLVIPVTSRHGKVTVKDVRIDYAQKWLNRHWRAIQSSYGKAPFFDHYAQDLETILVKKHTFLYDLNYDLVSLCLSWLKWTVLLKESQQYEKDIRDPVIDLRNKINSKKGLKNSKYLNQMSYPQVFGSKFVSDLSLLDLVFCEGPGASLIVCGGAGGE